MKKIYFLLFFSTFILFSSCNKKPLPETEGIQNDPSFYLKCNVNGAPINIQAGKVNYYMYSSNLKDTSNVIVYKGMFKQKDCGAGCGYSIAFLINDYKVSLGNASTYVDSGLYVGTYQFNDANIDAKYYWANFSPVNLNINNTYSWLVNESAISNNLNYSTMLTANKTYVVKLQSSGNCSAAHTNTFVMRDPMIMSVAAIQSTTSNLSFSFYSTHTGTSPYSYFWSFGDGTTSNLASPTHNYSTAGYYNAKLRLIDSSGDSSVYNYYVSAFTGQGCEANYLPSFIPMGNPLALSAISLEITDSAGNVYNSKELDQTNTSKIEILSIENYQPNERGEKTKKIKIKFNCTLGSGGSIINISGGEAVIAISYN
jgi:hypothetical protein